MADVTIACLCGKFKQQASLSTFSLPCEAALCHCSLCRSSSGLLCTSYLPLRTRLPSLNELTEYRASKNLRQFFCPACGAQIARWIPASSGSNYMVASGLIHTDGNVLRITHQTWVSDSVDGGLSFFLPPVMLSVETSQRHSSFAPEDPPSATQIQEDDAVPSGPVRENRLEAGCHCGGVSFFITPPDDQSSNASSPWPDLLVPYHSNPSENPQDAKWWLRANQQKYLAGLCACRSCRLASGFPIQPWAFIPLQNIRWVSGQHLRFDKGTLRRFESSPGTYREFCGKCGATIFWHCEARPSIIDVSVGILKAGSGARAGAWLEWETRRVSFIEEALDQELVRSLFRDM